MPSPRENSALWDYIVIGKVTLPPPGVVGYVHVDSPIKWKNDAKTPKGKNGARATTQGRDKSPVTIELVIQDALTSKGESQYDITQEAIDELSSSPGPYGVAHGATDAGRVRDILIDEISSPKPSAGQISWTIKAQRWDAPAAVIGGTSGVGSSPADLAKLEAQFAALEAELQINIALQNTNTSIFKAKEAELKALGAKIAQLKSSATKTPDKSDPTKQYYQDGNKAPKPGVPLGEWQP